MSRQIYEYDCNTNSSRRKCFIQLPYENHTYRLHQQENKLAEDSRQYYTPEALIQLNEHREGHFSVSIRILYPFIQSIC